MKELFDKLLSTNEASVYYDLLNFGSSKPADIAKRTKIPRNKVYDVLYKLESKKLIVSESSTTKRYSLMPPKNIVALANNHYLEQKQIFEQLSNELPQLNLLYSSSVPQPYFTYTHGLPNILKDIREEIKNTKEYVYLFAKKMDFFEEHELILAYRRLVKKGVDVRIITRDNPATRKIIRSIGAKAIYIPEDILFKKTMIVKENLFAISLYGQHEGVRLKTESRELIDTFKSLFLLIWDLKKEK
jgi:sugar-specific transcriptional regulator TrmB